MSFFVLCFVLCSGWAAGDGALPARRAAGSEDSVPAADSAERGATPDVQHSLLGKGKAVFETATLTSRTGAGTRCICTAVYCFFFV